MKYLLILPIVACFGNESSRSVSMDTSTNVTKTSKILKIFEIKQSFNEIFSDENIPEAARKFNLDINEFFSLELSKLSKESSFLEFMIKIKPITDELKNSKSEDDQKVLKILQDNSWKSTPSDLTIASKRLQISEMTFKSGMEKYSVILEEISNNEALSELISLEQHEIILNEIFAKLKTLSNLTIFEFQDKALKIISDRLEKLLSSWGMDSIENARTLFKDEAKKLKEEALKKQVSNNSEEQSNTEEGSEISINPEFANRLDLLEKRSKDFQKEVNDFRTNLESEKQKLASK